MDVKIVRCRRTYILKNIWINDYNMTNTMQHANHLFKVLKSLTVKLSR